MIQRILRAFGKLQIVFGIRQLIAGIDHGIRWQPDDIIKRGNGNIIIILRIHEGLLLISQLHL